MQVLAAGANARHTLRDPVCLCVCACVSSQHTLAEASALIARRECLARDNIRAIRCGFTARVAQEGLVEKGIQKGGQIDKRMRCSSESTFCWH